MADRAIALFGTTEPLPEQLDLHAGPLSATFENGQLRWIKAGRVEILRGVSFLVRDSTWLTAEPEIYDLSIDQRADGFTVGFNAHCPTKDGAIDWHGRIDGSADGSIVFDGTARPKQDFTTNRTGFVVLHPLDGVAGEPVHVGFTDGSFVDSRFPDLIDPYQPFKNIRSLSHQIIPGVTATCTVEGDAWEMEDHRNWTDASFKTYVRLLEWGYPYVIEAGREVRQRVTLKLSGPQLSSLERSSSGSPSVTVALGEPAGRFPEIGLSLPKRRLAEAKEAASVVKRLRPGFLHCRLDTRQGDGVELLNHYREAARVLETRVAIEVTVSDAHDIASELAAAALAVAAADIHPAAVIAVPSTAMLELSPGKKADRESIAQIPAAARAAFPEAMLGGGVFGFFTELNRNTPPTAPLDFVTHLTSALVHHTDDAAVMETVAAVPAVVRSARILTGGGPHWLGPANIGLDDNPYGECTPNPDNRRLTMARMDPRHRGLFGAAWLVGYVAAAAGEGVAAIITSAPAGELGVAYVPTDYPQPYFDQVGPGTVYPIYHVVRAFCAATGAPLRAARSSDPQRVAALAATVGGAEIVWLANLTPLAQTVDLPPGKWSARILDEEHFEAAAGDPDFFDGEGGPLEGRLNLPPYAVARLNGG